jgi:hypothetical protein
MCFLFFFSSERICHCRTPKLHDKSVHLTLSVQNLCVCVILFCAGSRSSNITVSLTYTFSKNMPNALNRSVRHTNVQVFVVIILTVHFQQLMCYSRNGEPRILLLWISLIQKRLCRVASTIYSYILCNTNLLDLLASNDLLICFIYR